MFNLSWDCAHGPLRFVATLHVFVNDQESAAGVANTFFSRQIHKYKED